MIAVATTSSASAVHVRAVGIPDRLYYEMDADMPPDRPLQWPIKEVVAREQIASTDVGILAFHAGSGATTVFLPVVVSDPGAPPSSMQPFIAVFRVGALANPRWRFISTSGNVESFAPAEIDDNRVTITLPPELHLPGRLEIGWDEEGSGKSHITAFTIGD
jgi:hypothetical protein